MERKTFSRFFASLKYWKDRIGWLRNYFQTCRHIANSILSVLSNDTLPVHMLHVCEDQNGMEGAGKGAYTGIRDFEWPCWWGRKGRLVGGQNFQHRRCSPLWLSLSLLCSVCLSSSPLIVQSLLLPRQKKEAGGRWVGGRMDAWMDGWEKGTKNNKLKDLFPCVMNICKVHPYFRIYPISFFPESSSSIRSNCGSLTVTHTEGERERERETHRQKEKKMSKRNFSFLWCRFDCFWAAGEEASFHIQHHLRKSWKRQRKNKNGKKERRPPRPQKKPNTKKERKVLVRRRKSSFFALRGHTHTHTLSQSALQRRPLTHCGIWISISCWDIPVQLNRRWQMWCKKKAA